MAFASSPNGERVPNLPPVQDQNLSNDQTESGPEEITRGLTLPDNLPTAELCEAQRNQDNIVDWIRKQRIANMEQREREDLGGHVAQVQLAFRLNHEQKKEIIAEFFKGERHHIENYFLERQRIIEEEKRRLNPELQERVDPFEPGREANRRLGDDLPGREDIEQPDQRQVDENAQQPGRVPEDDQEQARSPGDHQGIWESDSGEEADDEESDQEGGSDKENSGEGRESGEVSRQGGGSHEEEYLDEGGADGREREHGREVEFNLVEEIDEESVEPGEVQDDGAEISDGDLELDGIEQKIHEDVNRILDGQRPHFEGHEANARLQMRLGSLAVEFHAQRLSRLRTFHDRLFGDEIQRLGEQIPQEAREVGDLIMDLYHQLHLIELGAKNAMAVTRFFVNHKKKIQEFWSIFQSRNFHVVLSHPYYRIFDEIPLFGMPYFTQKEAKDPDTKDPLEFALPVHYDHRVNKMQKRRPGR